MSAVVTTIAMILEGLEAALSAGAFGSGAQKVAPIVGTIAALAELPDQFAPQRAALLQQVQGWVQQGVEPTDAELQAFADQRDLLFKQAQTLRASLG